MKNGLNSVMAKVPDQIIPGAIGVAFQVKQMAIDGCVGWDDRQANQSLLLQGKQPFIIVVPKFNPLLLDHFEGFQLTIKDSGIQFGGQKR